MGEFLKPEFALLDGKIQQGYKLLQQTSGNAKACRVWLEAWSDFLNLYDKQGTKTIKQFDQSFNGTEFVSDWVQDLESELWNVGLDDPQFFSERIALCETLLEKFGDDGETLRKENSRRSLAECFAQFQQLAKVDEYYDAWLKEDSKWGWGWIGWADCYFFAKPETKDVERAVQLLKQVLKIEEVRDRNAILDRLANVLDDIGRTIEADEVRSQVKEDLPSPLETFLSKSSKTSEFGKVLKALCSPQAASAPGSYDTTFNAFESKHGPCRCGSGKKFKKCCGKGLKF